MRKKTSKSTMRATKVSQSKRAGIIFPAARFHRKLRSMPQSTKRVSKGAGVYMAAVLEYLTAEIAELSGNACRDNNNARISPRHVFLAISLDKELDKLLKKVIIPGGGVLPSISPDILPDQPKTGTTKKVTFKSGPSTAKPKLLKKKSSTEKKSKKDLSNIDTTVLSERTLNKGQKLTVMQADITNVVANAIVHPTSNSYHLAGQVGLTISGKGGQEIRDIVAKLHRDSGNLAVGGVNISDAGSTLLCEKIIHVYSPSWDVSNQTEKIDELSKVVNNILTLADTNKLEVIALPSISSGENGYPKQVAAQTILRAINAYFRELDKAGTVSSSSIKQVIFVLYDTESVNIYTSELGKLDISSSS